MKKRPAKNKNVTKTHAPSKNRDAASAAPDSPAPSADLLEMDQAIELLKTTRPTFYRWLRAGKLKGMKVGRQWRFYRADVERFLNGEEPRIEVTGDLAGLFAALDEKENQAAAPGEMRPPTNVGGQNIVNAVNRIILGAIHANASDIHIQPPSKSAEPAVVRFRIDSVLHPYISFDARLLPAFVERIKTMAGCDLNEKRMPQDGRIQLLVNDDPVDLRISFVPALLGEAITLRVIRDLSAMPPLTRIVTNTADLERIKSALTKPWGIIFVTGPTGSGKSTTLYSALAEVNTPERKIMTVDDPIEYTFPNAVQVPVNPRLGLSFPVVLRSFMRADPDVIMVGQVSDRDTLELCAQFALTGKLVLSTLHTDEAVASVQRLIDIGLDAFLLIDAVKLIVGQRLVRALCTHCSAPIEPGAERLAIAGRLARDGGVNWDVQPHKFRKAVGCKECSFTGYRRRIGITETLKMSPAIGAAIRRKTSADELRRIAVSEGMTTMVADALRHAAAGETTIEEALRLVGQG